jgi:hypothetical protein
VATRFYLPSTGAAPVNPAFNTSWDESGSADRLKCVVTKINSAMTDKTVAKGTGATRALVRQYVSDPIAAQTIAAGTVKGQVRCLESAANDNLDLVPLLIRVCSNDGSTFRSPAIIALGDYAAALEFATTLTNRKIADGDTTSSVDAQDGDRIVIEIGEKNSGTGSSVSGTFSFGDNDTTDLAEDTTTTTTNNPWIELSSNIVFGVGKWSDHLNAQQAPIKKLHRLSQTVSGSSSGSVGQNAANEGKGQKFTANKTGKLLRARFTCGKSGSPTDATVCKFYSDSSGLPGTLIATSLPVPATAVTGATVPYEFAVPPSVVDGTVYHAIIFRTGALDASNYYAITGVSTNPYAGGNIVRRSSGSWVEHSGEDCVFHFEIEQSDWYKFEVDRGAGKLRAYQSTDGGSSFTEQDSSNAPAIYTGAGFLGVAVQRKGGFAYVWIASAIDTIKKNFPFSMADNTWGTATTLTRTGVDPSKNFGLNIAGAFPLFHNFREFTDQAAATQDLAVFGNTGESISSVVYRRIGRQVSTTAGAVILTGAGATVHYDLRSLASDWRDWTYVFYTKSDSTQIQVATCEPSGVNNITPTIVGGLSNTTVDQTAKYPLGLGCHFWRDDVNYVCVPYVDGGTSKLLYCEVGSAANTAGNWQTSTITTQSAETLTSNPGFVVADSEQGGKLFYFFVDDTSGLLYWCHDSGSFSWTTPELFDGSTVVTGCAGTLSDQTVGMLLRDGSTGNLVFKTFDVFF